MVHFNEKSRGEEKTKKYMLIQIFVCKNYSMFAGRPQRYPLSLVTRRV
jgi:hypothetical protein